MIALAAPSIALGQGNAADARTLAGFLSNLINGQIIPILVAAALLYTLYAVVDFMAAKRDSQTKEEKKQRIFWGIIGLFIIISIWSLVAIVGRTFGIFAGGTLRTN